MLARPVATLWAASVLQVGVRMSSRKNIIVNNSVNWYYCQSPSGAIDKAIG